MARIDVKIPASESADLGSLSKGIMVQTGIGFVFLSQYHKKGPSKLY